MQNPMKIDISDGDILNRFNYFPGWENQDEVGDLRVCRASSADDPAMKFCYIIAAGHGADDKMYMVTTAYYNSTESQGYDYGKPKFNAGNDSYVVGSALLRQPPKYFHGTTVIIEKEGVELPMIVHDIKTRDDSYVYTLGTACGPEVNEEKLFAIAKEVIYDDEE
ncbi:uncharacterized protein AB675_8598 [Cyphellophora attinorum]|uniref:Uncharacterized protein n=1 Tax=Cyphellophora attinorum TaxID=1664694 RepID=A0A0N1H9S5_9EURO|nr:uncharacterized protein AB675_8598 [Phialophora attinorum]KPI44397.1 hypothetical protein AB675_8598 [Phialophora attinorum]